MLPEQVHVAGDGEPAPAHRVPFGHGVALLVGHVAGGETGSESVIVIVCPRHRVSSSSSESGLVLVIVMRGRVIVCPRHNGTKPEEQELWLLGLPPGRT